MKKFWKSKVFWLNILAIITELLGINPLKPETALIVASAANLGLRFITNKQLISRGPETHYD